MRDIRRLIITASICVIGALSAFSFAGCGGETPSWIEQMTCEHEWMDGIVTTEPTCTKEGKETIACEKCGKTKTKKVAKAEHDEVLLLSRDATCEIDGVELYECKNCEEQRTVVVEASGHIELLMPGYAATCTEEGVTDGVSCEVCGKVLEEQKAIPATGHSKIYEPSATGDGTHTSSCEACGLSFEVEEHIPGEWVTVGEVGVDVKDVQYCVCGEELSVLNLANVDENGNEIVLDVDLNIEEAGQESTATFSLNDALSPALVTQTIGGFSGLFYNDKLIYTQAEIMANFAAVPATIFNNNLGVQELVLGLITNDGAVHNLVMKFNVVNNAKVEVDIVDGECVAGNWYRIYNATSTSSDDWFGGFVISDGGENQLFLYIWLFDGSGSEGNAGVTTLAGSGSKVALDETLYVVGDGYTDIYLPAGTVLSSGVPTGPDTSDTTEITIDENTVIDLSVAGPSSQEVVIKRLVPVEI